MESTKKADNCFIFLPIFFFRFFVSFVIVCYDFCVFLRKHLARPMCANFVIASSGAPASYDRLVLHKSKKETNNYGEKT